MVTYQENIMRDCGIIFVLFLCFLSSIAFSWISQNHVFPSPVLQKFIKSLEKQHWIAPFLVKCGGREWHYICGRVWLQYDWQVDPVRGQIQNPMCMASYCHDKNIENSQLSLSIYTLSSLVFHKPLTYDRNHIPQSYTVAKIMLHSLQH